MKLKGKAHKYGANVDTDAIIPARYLNVWEPAELAAHCMEDIDEEFLKRVKPGDIIVATTNYGCGSSREHAPIALKAAGVSCVIAQSFARIFFRNAINLGLPLLECTMADRIDAGNELEVTLETGEIKNITKHRTYKSEPYPEFMLQLVSAGGLIDYTKKRIQSRGAK